MPFLSDGEIAPLLSGSDPLATNVRIDGFDHRDSAVQACTLDLTIGDIFVPERKGTEDGSANMPLSRFSLEEGATAVVRTAEVLSLPPDMGAIAFPPAHMSVQGLLMTNPGHVDPGYSGPMHFTVINLGSEDYELRRGERVVRVLFFKLKADAKVPYDKRKGRTGGRSFVTQELLGRLSPDFLNVNRRAREAATNAVRGVDLWAKVIVPILTVLVSGGFSIILAMTTVGAENDRQLAELNERVSRLDGRIGGLGANVNLDALESRVSALEEGQQPE